MKIAIEGIKITERRRRLNMEKVAELEKSIQELGLLQAILVTPDYRLVAGRHRLEACKRIGWTEIEATVFENSEALKVELAEIDENLTRNEGTQLERNNDLKRRKEIYEALYPETKAKVAGGKARQKTATDKMSFAEDTAKKTGKSARTVRRSIKIANDIPADVQETIADTPTADKQSDLLKLAKQPEEVQRKAADLLKSGEAKDVQAALTSVKRTEAAERGKLITVEKINLIHGDFSVVSEGIEAGSVDLIFTDPPYHERYLSLWADLGKTAKRLLKPGGLLIAYSGQEFLPQVLTSVGAHLDYYWLMATPHKHGNLRIWHKQVWNAWKPIIAWSNGKPTHQWFTDLLTGGETEAKGGHDWAQPMLEADRILEWFCQPGQLVLDPMCGSGTIPIAAARRNLKSVGIEINEDTYNIAKGRAFEILGGAINDAPAAA